MINLFIIKLNIDIYVSNIEVQSITYFLMLEYFITLFNSSNFINLSFQFAENFVILNVSYKLFFFMKLINFFQKFLFIFSYF